MGTTADVKKPERVISVAFDHALSILGLGTTSQIQPDEQQQLSITLESRGVRVHHRDRVLLVPNANIVMIEVAG